MEPGCAARQSAGSTQNVMSESAIKSLLDRESVLTSLQTPVIMDYSAPSGHIRVREQITVQRPGNLRVEALSPLGVALIVVADSSRIAVFNPGENLLIRGRANAETLGRFVHIPVAPSEAVRLLLALPPAKTSMAAAMSGIRTESGMSVISYHVDSRRYELGFAAGRLASARAYGATGELEYEVQYRAYRDIGAMQFPFELQARFPSSATLIKLDYLNPSIDRQIADSIFVLSPGPTTRVIEIGAANWPRRFG